MRPLLDLPAVEALITEMPEQFKVLTIVMFWAALRIDEAVAIQNRDVDLAARVLRVERQQIEPGTGPVLAEPKASSKRTVNLPDQAVKALTEWIDTHPGATGPSGLHPVDGTLLRAQHVQWAFRQAAKRAGIEGARPHDLRHASLTLTAQLGGTTAEVQRRARHASARAALIYQHAAESRDADLARMLSALDQARLKAPPVAP